MFVKEITSIGAVDEGDNPKSRIVFWKRKKGSAESAEQTQGDEMSKDINALPDAAQEHIQELEKAAEVTATQIEALEAQIAELTPAEDPVEAIVEKASDEVQTLIAKLREDNDTQAEAIAVEVAKRRDTEYIAKVREDNLEMLLGKPEEVGPALRELADAAPDAFGKIYPALQAASQRAGLADVFKELGANDGDLDPQAQKVSWITKQKQDGSDKSDAELANDFWAAHPDAVAAERDK